MLIRHVSLVFFSMEFMRKFITIKNAHYPIIILIKMIIDC